MLSGDCQSQGLAEWLKALGCLKEHLEASKIRKLNTPKMRSVWRHLQAHLHRVNKVNFIRRNVLLDSLEEENICVGQFQNVKFDSMDQLKKMKEIIKVEENKDGVREEITAIDKKVHNENSSLLHKITMEKLKRHELNEIEDKTTILELKNTKLLNDCKKMNDTKETVGYLKNSKTLISQAEINCQKSSVCIYVENNRYPSKDSVDHGEYLSEMMSSILEFKPICILDAITQNAKGALKLLNSLVDRFESIVDSFYSVQNVTFQEKLREFKILVIKKELKICKDLENISLEKCELQMEMTQLVEALSKKVEDNVNIEKTPELCNVENGEDMMEEKGCANNNKSVTELIGSFLKKCQLERENNYILEKKNCLVPDLVNFEPLEFLKHAVQSLFANEEELYKEIKNKVSEVNIVVSQVYRNLIDSGELNEFQAESSLMASDFKTETNQINMQNINCGEFTDMILKEVQVLHRIPMVALQRNWNKNNEFLVVDLAKSFSEKLLLLSFLLQAEKKNAIVNVLLKHVWSLQFWNSHSFSES